MRNLIDTYPAYRKYRRQEFAEASHTVSIYAPSVANRLGSNATRDWKWVAGGGGIGSLLGVLAADAHPILGGVTGLLSGALIVAAGSAIIESQKTLPATVSITADGDRPASVQQLIAIANSQGSEHRWHAGDTLAKARNAHYANTQRQIEMALRGPYNTIEGDVRIANKTAVMAHDRSAPSNLTFEEWARIGQAAGKLLRIDVKEARAIDLISATVRALNIPADQIMFNVTAGNLFDEGNQSIAALRKLRELHPGVAISLNWPSFATGIFADGVISAANAIGRPVATALEAQQATRELVRQILPHATVNIWNSPSRYSPINIAAETQRLRDLGVDGMIDLRQVGDPFEKP